MLSLVMNVKGGFSDKQLDTSVGQLVQRYYFWNIKASILFVGAVYKDFNRNCYAIV